MDYIAINDVDYNSIHTNGKMNKQIENQVITSNKILEILIAEKTIEGISDLGQTKIVQKPDNTIDIIVTNNGSSFKMQSTDPHFNKTLLESMLKNFRIN